MGHPDWGPVGADFSEKIDFIDGFDVFLAVADDEIQSFGDGQRLEAGVDLLGGFCGEL